MSDARLYRIAVAVGCIVALSVLTRYASVFLIPAIFLYLISLKHYRPALVFGSVASTSFLWLGRNYLLTHTLMGPRVQSGLSWFEALRDIIVLSLQWAVVIGGIYALAAFVYVLFLHDYVGFNQQRRHQRGMDAARASAPADAPAADIGR